MSPSEKLEFLPAGPFHDAVVAYMASLSGLVVFHPKFPVDLKGIPPIGLATNEAAALEIRPDEVKGRFLRGDLPLGPLTDSLIRLVANWTYEHAKDAYLPDEWMRLRETHPLLEFFRHLRNASSHRGGLWSFTKDEPRKPAEWRGRKLTRALQDRLIKAVRAVPEQVVAAYA